MKAYKAQAAILRWSAEWFLRHWFGERCDEYEPGCEACKRWRCLDEMLLDPFDDEVERIRGIVRRQSRYGPVPIPEVQRRYRNVTNREITREDVIRAAPDFLVDLVEEYPGGKE